MLHEEMELRHRELSDELARVVAEMLAAELGGVVPAGADFSAVARRIVDDSSIHVHDGRLRIRSSNPAVRELLEESFPADSASSEFSAAAERFLRAFSELEITAR